MVTKEGKKPSLYGEGIHKIKSPKRSLRWILSIGLTTCLVKNFKTHDKGVESWRRGIGQRLLELIWEVCEKEIIPKEWKEAIIRLLHEKGDKSDPSN